jgi:amino acid adenylation domain-containing protein
VSPPIDFQPFAPDEVEQSVPDRFERQVDRFPDRVAVVDRGGSWTYARLNAAANAIAQAVLARRGPTEEPVGLLLDESAMLIAAILGVLKAGKIYVPLDARFPPARLTLIIENARPGALVTDRAHRAAIGGLLPRDVSLIDVDEAIATCPRQNPGLTIAPGRGFHILYTSGSTGTPKGVLQNHRNLLFEMLRVTNSFRITPGDRLALLHSCGYSASLRRVFPALLNGASVHLWDIKRDGVADMPAWFTRQGITISNGRRLLRDCQPALTGEDQFPMLRLVTFGGEPVYRSDVDLFRRYLAPHCVMLINLASTETGSDSQFFIGKQTRLEDGPLPVGYATEGTELLILDEQGKSLGFDQVGQIAIRSRYLSLGYWRRDDLTRERYLPDPEGGDARIYLTGDIGRQRADGCLIHLGRRDFQVKVRGYRIETTEVEAALLGLGHFHEVVVMARDAPAANDGGGGVGEEIIGGEKRLVAYLTVNGPHAPEIQQLRRALGASLPDYMIPSSFVMLDQLPRTETGKIDRRALPDPDAIVRPSLSPADPRDELERAILSLWRQVLGRRPLGIRDHFLEAGGDSLLALKLLGLLEGKFAVSLPPAALLRAATVEDQARLLRRGAVCRQRESALVPLDDRGHLPPLYLVPPAARTALIFYDLARRLGGARPIVGIHHQGMEGRLPPHRRVEQMACHYVAAIRARQPAGPYFLGGQCFGGIVAFEMARQLRGQGAAVALLAILDTLGPPHEKARGVGVRISDAARATARSLAHWLRPGLRTSHRPTAPHEVWVARVFSAHRVARQSYVPDSPFDGTISFFRTRDTKLTTDRRAAWSRLTSQPLRVIEVPGQHFREQDGFLFEPHVRVLADRLTECLAQAQALADRATADDTSPNAPPAIRQRAA